MHRKANALFLNKLRPLHRLLISLSAFLAAFVSTNAWGMAPLVHWLSCWVAFSATYLALSWYTIVTMPVSAIIRRAGEEDGSRIFVSSFLLLAIAACLCGVLAFTIGARGQMIGRWPYLGISFLSIMFSWMLVHTLYAFHYAHLYYKDATEEAVKGEGLDFPGHEAPDYMDFVYFSIVLGCTFQVSDVEISSKRIRRVALFHGLLSFVMNTFVVALTINIIAGLVNG